MTRTPLYHFSDDPAIERFVPRPVRVPSERPEGMAWLNGPLVWTIDAWHEPLYLFPRDCPRILLWADAGTTVPDRRRWLGASGARMLAYVESGWLERVEGATLHRYALPGDTFRALDDAGMWVSSDTVVPLERETVDDLPGRLRASGVDLRVVADLASFREARDTTLHVSGIRLRNARGRRRVHPPAPPRSSALNRSS